MADYTTVVVDAMGGDNAPEEIIKGAIEALNGRKDLKLIITGDELKVNKELSRYTYDQSRVKVIFTSEVIKTAEHPVEAIRKKKDSSLVVGMRIVHDGDADAFVSAGNSGAILVGGQTIVGRMEGVKRAPLAPLIPTEKGVSLLIDCGANVDARADHLVTFARMGSVYMEHVVGKPNPTGAIVNIGAEEETGNALVKET